MRLRMIAAAAPFCALAASAAAQAAESGGPSALSWSWEPWVLASLATAGGCYLVGALRMRRSAALHGLVDAARIAAFAAGMLVLVIALVSPVDGIAEQLFCVHMVQHLLLLLVAPPLLVWSRPAIVFLWAFAPRPRKRIGRFWAGAGLGRGTQWLMQPVLVWLLFSGSFVFWHFPGPYQAAVRNEFVHALEHLSFFVTALMFWTIVIEPSGRRRFGYGATLLFIATTAFLSSLPGALIFLAPRPLYPVHASGVAAWGLTLMQDQQLAGVIMWIPGGLVYLAALQWVAVRWLGEDDRRASRRLRQSVLLPALGLLLALLFTGSGAAEVIAQSAAPEAASFGGDPDRGAGLITQDGCGACHVVPGIAGADGLVGPPLTMMGRRIYLAGLLRNTPDNMMWWLRQPQQVVPGNAMPDMGLSARDARDIAAYLYTLR